MAFNKIRKVKKELSTLLGETHMRNDWSDANKVTWLTLSKQYTINHSGTVTTNVDVWAPTLGNVKIDCGTNSDTVFTFHGDHYTYNGMDACTFEYTDSVYGGWGTLGAPNPPTKGELLRHRVKRQLAPAHIGRAKPDFSGAQENELVALQLLRSMIGSDAFRRYLRDGFIMVEGKSGKRYQVGRRDHLIGVWDNRGQKLGSLCVYIRDQKIPPTDEVVAKMLIIECDEPDIWRRARKMGLIHGLKGPDEAIPRQHVRQQARIVEQNIPGLIVRAA